MRHPQLFLLRSLQSVFLCQSSVFLRLLCSLQVINKRLYKNRTQPEAQISYYIQLEGAHLRIVIDEVVPSWCQNKCTRVNVRDISIFYLLVTFVLFTNITRFDSNYCVVYTHTHIHRVICRILFVRFTPSALSLWLYHGSKIILTRSCIDQERVTLSRPNTFEIWFYGFKVFWKCLYTDLCNSNVNTF
jgi:hypothetical protein